MRSVKTTRSASASERNETSAKLQRRESNPPSRCSSEEAQATNYGAEGDGACKQHLSATVTYDQSDHTVAFRSGDRSCHMMVLPRDVIHCPFGFGHAGGTSGGNHGAGPQTTRIHPGCDFVRISHPRHGEPALFLCPPLPQEGGSSALPDVALYEVQAQSPPGGFGQTWFVGDTVEPNEDLVVVTPFDVTFLALRQVATHAMKDKFLSAEDLIMGTSVGKDDKKGGSSWPGWGAALVQCPGLGPAIKTMQSDAVLSRICDVKCVGGDSYYRFSLDKMGAWLREKVRQVSECPALRSLLQLDTHAADGDGKEAVAPPVPLPVSFALVAEYVLQELCSTAAQLCGTRNE
ncbi:hypothetical protein TRVL_04721 [Trypanosoma vivax]|nr:hypothetical protein TRVL_04721 [Trypanosoma vivax]